jgi:hypothetical protein
MIRRDAALAVFWGALALAGQSQEGGHQPKNTVSGGQFESNRRKH